MKDSTGERSAPRAQTLRAIYRCSVVFRPICDFEVSGEMRATQRVAQVTWIGSEGGETGGDPGGRAEGNCFSYFIKSVVHFSSLAL